MPPPVTRKLMPLAHALHPPLPHWKFAARRLPRAGFCHLLRLAHGDDILGRVIYCADAADADVRGLLPAPPAAVTVWFFHPDAAVLSHFMQQVSAQPLAGGLAESARDQPAPLAVEAFSAFTSKRMCDAVKAFRSASPRTSPHTRPLRCLPPVFPPSHNV
jgi:hypothetical protein